MNAINHKLIIKTNINEVRQMSRRFEEVFDLKEMKAKPKEDNASNTDNYL